MAIIVINIDKKKSNKHFEIKCLLLLVKPLYENHH